MLVEVQEVCALHELVGELGERHAVAFAVEALLDGVFRHHVVDGDAFADVPDEFEERKIFHPVVVVDHLRGIRGFRREIHQAAQLLLDSFLVAVQRFFV